MTFVDPEGFEPITVTVLSRVPLPLGYESMLLSRREIRPRNYTSVSNLTGAVK